jgi:hypothetical protein
MARVAAEANARIFRIWTAPRTMSAVDEEIALLKARARRSPAYIRQRR